MFEKELSEATELLKKLIRIPSISREEDLCADLIENYIAENGYTVSRLKNNVWTIASGFDGNRPTLLLNSHIDTVKPVDGWTFDPFIPTEKDGKIYGLGSNDAGASVVALLHTFFLLSQENQPYDLIFSATAEEEFGIPAIIALPAAGCLRTPFAQWTSNAAGFRLFVILPGMALGECRCSHRPSPSHQGTALCRVDA